MIRRFSLISACLIKKNKLPPRPKFTRELEFECEEKFLHGGRGPGGQKINKCNSKVQLKHLQTGIVVTCQETRSRENNRKIAREKMALELERLQNNTDLTRREHAIYEWTRQGKRAKVKRSKSKHMEHQEKRQLAKDEQQQIEQQILQTILDK
ncbi:hypothetical protein HG535_0G02400 [Zygotorulaspora mrakii]|uniref:Prokaryotic-type class I peptide chain release factors domain-containing protein n=1 Tax=Zygotorulaspora mrakii TaxID=42260 RepID=A0A7H9B7L1_ZYGMR|nr:uncharacterized protein HG535_0G02400 [Zygotorulaspora mrakii]QLG74356.1 hypothetical protein HG535_0G02400 [Zygotorulaspora mrakii]